MLALFHKVPRHSVQKPSKSTFSITPLSFDRELPANIRINLCRQKPESMAYIFAGDSMGVSSFIFVVGSETHLFSNRVYRPFKVIQCR